MKAIVAVDKDNAIGRKGKLLFHSRDDMNFFKRTTIGKTIVYGRKTLETFPHGKPLPGRRNIVLSRNKNLKVPGAEVVHSISELKETSAWDSQDTYIIGGAKIYEQLLDYCDEVMLTRFLEEVGDADAFFPDIAKMPEWELASSGPVIRYQGLKYRFDVFRRKD